MIYLHLLVIFYETALIFWCSNFCDVASNAQRTEGTTNHQNYTVAAMLSSFMVKQSSAAAYLMKHRSMTSPDIIDQIGEVMYSLESSKAI